MPDLDVPPLGPPPGTGAGSEDDATDTFSAASTISRVVQPDLGGGSSSLTDSLADDLAAGPDAGPPTGTADAADGTAAPGVATDGPADDESSGHEHTEEAVTFDDVVIAATNLTTLLDPATASYVLDLRPR